MGWWPGSSGACLVCTHDAVGIVFCNDWTGMEFVFVLILESNTVY